MRGWAIELVLSALVLSWGCAGVRLRPTRPRGVPSVRVLLVSGAEKVHLWVSGPHRAVVGTNQYTCDGSDHWVVSFSGGTLKVRLGQSRALEDACLPVLLIPGQGETVAVNGRPYRGQLRVEPGPGKGLNVVNLVNLEDYLKGVLPCELGPVRESTLEAAKAQAVAARTYALSHMARNSREGYDLEATQADQVYGGLGAESELSNKAVEETFGIVASHDGRVIEAKYSSTCGGWTANVEDCWGGEVMPYLRSVYDGPYRSLERGKPFCSHSPRFRWVVKWKWRDFFRRVKENMAPLVGRPETELGEILSVKIANRDRSGRARTVEVKTAKGRYEVKRVAIRELFKTPTGSLRSTAFHLQVKGDWVVAEGSGFGHGVGLCQWGAMGMARRGYGYREILRHYYRGVELRRIY